MSGYLTGVALRQSQLVGKLQEQRVANLTDAELDRALSGCVSHSALRRMAQTLRDSGQLTMQNGSPTLN